MILPLQILILGHGKMGHAMEFLLKDRYKLAIWEKFPSDDYRYVTLEDSAASADVVLFCLPVNPHREVVQFIAPLLKKTCLCVSIAKGLDESGQTAAQIFAENLPAQQPYALLYGPMISEEIRAGRHAFAQLGSQNPAACNVMQTCFDHTRLHIEHTSDMIGISWSVILKNVYAMAFGMADELKLGDNVRGFLAVTALHELSQIVSAMGGKTDTPYRLAGLGDLITTATSESSHHHELGRKVARKEYNDVSGEGPHTLQMIHQHRLINMQNYPLLCLIDRAIRQSCDASLLFAAYLDHSQE